MNVDDTNEITLASTPVTMVATEAKIIFIYNTNYSPVFPNLKPYIFGSSVTGVCKG